MKEISEAEMLEAIKFAHEHIKIKFQQLRLQAALVKKEVRTYEGEDEAIYAKVKQHLMIKFMLLQRFSKTRTYSSI
jgi:polyribonucleotide nucleotidyltransferase